MDSHSFIWMMKTAGEGSGGAFASGEFQRRSWINSEPPCSLELHCRYSLGMVTYRIGPLSLSHVDYMLAVTGRSSATRYPGFSTDPLDGFRRLRADLMEHCAVFLSCGAADFAAIHQKAHELKQRSRIPD